MSEIYRIYCDGILLYHSKLENLQLVSPSLELELNKTGSFVFGVLPDHPCYGLIKKLKSIITVYDDNYLLFRGRVLNDEIGFHNEKTVSCEGELAFFLDSIQRPYDFTGSITDYISDRLAVHNAQVEPEKQFSPGNVTVTDENNYIVRANANYADTWSELTDKLVNLLGGYLIVRHEDGVNYLDYSADFSLLSPQEVKFGENLVDIKRTRRGEDICTALIPLGAKIRDEEDKETEQRLTIADVNNGLDYIIDQAAADAYGLIFRSEIWDDVTEGQNLLTKGRALLSELSTQPDVIEITAADLTAPYHLGTYVHVDSAPHQISQNFLVTRISAKLFEPWANKITLGGIVNPLSGALQGMTKGQESIERKIETASKTISEAVYNVEQNFRSDISQTESNIKSAVYDRVYLKDEVDALISETSSKFTQTATGFQMDFAELSKSVDALSNGLDAEFEEVRKYIRYTDGKILLGEVGNELELQIANDRISFLQDGAEVAYFSNRKLYVTDAEILHGLQLGNFAFMPRANGNLSFKKSL